MKSIFILMLLLISSIAFSQKALISNDKDNNILPVRGLCIGTPSPKGVNEFIKFIDEELAPRLVNILVLRVDYNYEYKSHPELRNSGALSKNDVKRIVAVCKKNNISIIPQVNLLGHQSWLNELGNLLRVYPQFDETPLVEMPVKYVWPNGDRLYCKSYCPLHPDIHKVVFDLIDEICDVFETDTFHAGMDEVFYIGEEQCPRCSGKNKAELFAGEVRTIHDHLALKKRKLWIWGDRLIDGKTTGIHEWEASHNDTHWAVDMIPKDVVICDWHYDRPDHTPVYFAMKGFNVITCPWDNPANAVLQIQNMFNYRKHSTPEMKVHFWGMMQTVWSSTETFLDIFYKRRPDAVFPDRTDTIINTEAKCFEALYNEIHRISCIK